MMDQSLYQRCHLRSVERQLVDQGLVVALPVVLLLIRQDLVYLLIALRLVKTCLFVRFILSRFTVLAVL